MGSFNMFCAISNAPIHHYDRIVVFVLDGESDWMARHREQYPDREGPVTCWPRCGLRMGSLPLRGAYNDYGGIDIDEGQDDRIQMAMRYGKYFGRYAEKTKDGEWKIHGYDHPEEIHNNNYPMMFIHEDVYNYIISRPGLDESGYMSNWRKERVAEQFKAWEQAKADYQAALAMPDDPKWDEEAYKKLSKEERSAQVRASKHFKLYHVGSVFKETFIGSGGETYGHPHEAWSEFEHTLNEAMGMAYYNEVRPVLEYSQIFGYRIAPSLYAGQQSRIEDRNEINKIIATVAKRHKDRWGDDEDEGEWDGDGNEGAGEPEE